MSRVAEDAFIAARERDWNDLDGLLSMGKRLHKLAPDRIAKVGALYRTLCADVARARAAGYSRETVAHLDALAARAHAVIYRSEPYRRGAIRDLLLVDFPRSVRGSTRFMLASTALFLLPFLLGLFGALASSELAATVVPQGMLDAMAENYSGGVSEGRSEDTDTAMAGFYVYNNVGIAFRCFATGIFFGLGSAFFLVYNGVVTGVVVGYVIESGAGRGILTFVCGHGAFELTAIVIAGAAGLRMGYALVRTDGRTRLGSLRAQAPHVARLVLGAAIMLGIAALVEAFWSPSSIPDPVKWGVASLLWMLVMLYFVAVGRPRAEAVAR
jgi:uncharacterized membrane protein SpoIIM required for sporulation